MRFFFCATWTDSTYFQGFLGKTVWHTWLWSLGNTSPGPFIFTFKLCGLSILLCASTATSTRSTWREETGRMQGTDVSCQTQLCQLFSILYALDDEWHQPYHLFNQILVPVNSLLPWITDNLIQQSCPTISMAICHVLPKRKIFEVILRIRTEWHESASQDVN